MDNHISVMAWEQCNNLRICVLTVLFSAGRRLMQLERSGRSSRGPVCQQRAVSLWGHGGGKRALTERFGGTHVFRTPGALRTRVVHAEGWKRVLRPWPSARGRAGAASASGGRSLRSASQWRRGPALGCQSAPSPAAGPLIRARVHSSGRGGRGRAPATLFGRRPV